MRKDGQKHRGVWGKMNLRDLEIFKNVPYELREGKSDTTEEVVKENYRLPLL